MLYFDQLRRAEVLLSTYFPRILRLINCELAIDLDDLCLKAIAPHPEKTVKERTIVFETRTDFSSNYSQPQLYLRIFLESFPEEGFAREIGEFAELHGHADTWCYIEELLRTVRDEKISV